MFIDSLLSGLSSISRAEDVAHIGLWIERKKKLLSMGVQITMAAPWAKKNHQSRVIDIMISQKVLLRLTVPGYVFFFQISDMIQLQVLFFACHACSMKYIYTNMCKCLFVHLLCLVVSSCCQHMQQQIASEAQIFVS